MGYGAYSHDAHLNLTRSRADLGDEQIFRQSACHPLMSPKGVKLRESRDSEAHPNSIGVVFALDVTGSMGTIPKLLAREELPHFMKVLGDCGVPDPQLMFMAVGDVTSDRAPLQVGQFESTAELMDQWLTWSYLEGNGGGTGSESYEIAMYFVAEHTEMDCLLKRKKKGYLFMTGDEIPYPAVARTSIDTLIGDRLDEDIPVEEVVAVLKESYHPFFIVPDLRRRARCERRWRQLLGDHVLCVEDGTQVCFAAAGALALTEGIVKDFGELEKRFRAAGADDKKVRAVLQALGPYAATLGVAGAPSPVGAGLGATVGGALKRLFK